MDTVADSTTPPTEDSPSGTVDTPVKETESQSAAVSVTPPSAAPSTSSHTWQFAPSPKYRRNRRWLLFSLLIFVTSLSAFIWAIISPFNRSHTRLLLVSATALPSDLADDLLKRTDTPLHRPLREIFGTQINSDEKPPAVPSNFIAPSSITKLLPMIRAALAAAKLSKQDEVLCLTEFPLACRHGSLYFCGHVDPTDTEEGLIKFRDFSHAVAESTPAIVTMFLDLQQVIIDPRAGLIDGDYDSIRKLVSRSIVDCPNIHVVLARPRETTDDSAPTPPFVEVVATGWQGAADADENGTIDWQEFLQYADQFHAVELLDHSGLVADADSSDLAVPILDLKPSPSGSNAEESQPTWQMPLKDAKESTSTPTPALADLSTSELLAKCWRIRDKLSAFDANFPLSRRRLKSDLAPVTWRRLGEELIAFERVASWPHPKVTERLKPWLLSRCEDLAILNGGTGDLSFIPDWTRRFTCPIGANFAWSESAWPLALYESAASLSSEATTTEIANARELLTQFIQNDTQTTPDKLPVETKIAEHFAEFQFLSRLRQNSHLTDSQIRLAVETRVLSEQLAASSEATAWFADSILATDRIRLRADRSFLEGRDAKVLNLAGELYRQSLSQYRVLAAKTEHILAAYEARDDALQKLPSYRHLTNETTTANPPLDDALSNFVHAIEQMLGLLASHDSNRIAELGRTRRVVEAAEMSLRRLLHLEGDGNNPRLAALKQLHGDLFSAETRLQLWQEWFARHETSRFQLVEPQSKSRGLGQLDFQPVSLETLLGRCRREVVFAELLQPISKMQDGSDQEIIRLQESWMQLEKTAKNWQSSREASTDVTFRKQLNQFAKRLTVCFSRIPTLLASASPSEESDIVHLLTLMDPRDRVPDSVEAMTKRLRQKDWESVLDFQLRRRLCFESDATPDEHQQLRREQNAFAIALLRLDATSSVRFDGNNLVSDIKIDDNASDSIGEITWRLRLHNRSSAALPVWVWMSQLPREIRCSLSPEIPTQLLDAHANSLPFAPYSIKEPQDPASLILDAGEQREVIGTLRIKPGYVTPGTLVVRLVSPTSPNGQSDRFARDEFHTDRYEVPWLNDHSALAHWSAAGGAVDRKQTKQRVAGWPNQLQRSVCRLANPNETERTVEVRCYHHPAADSPAIPNHKLTRLLVDQLLLLKEFESPLFVIPSLTLPAGGSTIPLPFPKTKLKQPIDISRGLIVVIRDLKTGEASCLVWQGSPHDPLSSVATQVDYDANRRQIQARFRWRDELPIPPDGLPVKMALRNPIDQSVLSFRSAMLKPGQPGQTLLLDGVDDRWEKYRVTIDMADWPRILHFDVDTNRSAIDIQPVTGPPSIQFLSPANSAAFLPSDSSVPVRLRADVPRGPLDGGPIHMSIGFDKSHSRWPERQVFHFQSDRQVRTELHGIAEGGKLIWEPRVTDFDFQFPIDPTGETQTNLVAVVERHDQQARALVPLVFDRRGPKIRGVEVLSPAEMVVDSTVSLSIHADDEGLSGTDRVEVVIDAERSAQFPAGVKPKLGVLSDQDRWVVQLPMKGMPAGITNVLVRGVDAVGNIGPTFSRSIELLDPSELERRREASTPTVTGRVVYLNQPIGHAEIKLVPVPPKSGDGKSDDPRTQLSTKTDDQGAFVIPHVPPGAWTVEVIGSVAGFRSHREWPVKVAQEPAPQPLLLDLGRPVEPDESQAP